MEEKQLALEYDKSLALTPDENMTLALVSALRNLSVQNHNEGIENKAMDVYAERLVNSEPYKTAMEKIHAAEKEITVTEYDQFV